MIVVHCPECNAGMQVVFNQERYEGWKQCSHCKEPVYIRADTKQQSTVSLLSILSEILKKKPGKDFLTYISSHDEQSLDDVLFNSSKIMQSDVEFLAQVKVLDKTLRGYSLKPQFKSFVEKVLLT